MAKKKASEDKTPLESQISDFEGFVEFLQLSADDPTVLNQNLKQTPTQGGWIEYGKGDTQFQYLLTLYVNSVTHNAIIDALARMTYGKGLNKKDVIDPDDNKRVIKDMGIFGNFTLQVTGEDIFHTPVQYYRANPSNADGVIEGYWFSTDFSDKTIEPEFFPAWTEDWIPSEEHASAIYWGKTYTPNAFYYGLPPYQGGLSYMEQEIEVAKFLLKYIKNNFSVTKIINFNNGTSDPKSRDSNTKGIKKKFTGTDGDIIIVAHNKSKEHAATVEDVTVSNASEQYAYMTENARGQIVVAHQVISPLLVGIRDSNSGFNSNGDELAMSRALLEETKIEPDQEFIADAFRTIKKDPSIKYISSVGSVEKVDEQIEETQLKKVKPNPEFDSFLELGVDDMEGMRLVASVDVHDYDIIDQVEGILDDFQLETVMLASTGKATPLTKSKQDKDGFAVRYRYAAGAERKVSFSESRAFCTGMMGANKLYTKENIQAMRNRPVNPGFGKGGTNTYDIWLYQGGGLLSGRFPKGTCMHFWRMEVYIAEETSDPSRIKLGDQISNAVAIRNGISPLQNNVQVHTTNWSQQ